MAFVNKVSLREEFDYLKNQFSELQSQNKLSTEANILFRSMIILFEVMISVFLERKTKKNSGNSSIPPSQTNKDETSSSSQGSNGKRSYLKTMENKGYNPMVAIHKVFTQESTIL